ncbi:DNA polymerase delta subunit 3 [Schistosoma japonicum]|uniref:DNA polymerase delta subunit 3 n=3 Tax=Schistosoma japonicum TaxID=6182 RepID=A0A4Z2CTU9_SCHJA|nr:DNA polymerase delta subunit 3 [Schistosoma japonicum]
MEDQLLFENLDEKLEDENGFITANWLSITFDLNVGASRRLMESYLLSRDKLSSVYLLTGISTQGEILVRLADSDQLSVAKQSFAFPPKCVVYSIQRRKCKDSLSLAFCDLLHNISGDQLKRLTSIPWDPSTNPSRKPLSGQENQETALYILKAPVDTPVLPNLATSGRSNKIRTSDFKNFFIKPEKPIQDEKTLQDNLKPSTETNVKPKPIESAKLNDLLEEDEEFSPKTACSSQKRKRIVIESDEDEVESTLSRDCLSSELLNSKENTKHADKYVQKKKHIRSKEKVKLLSSDSETQSSIMKPAKRERSPNHERIVGVIDSSTPTKCEENPNNEKSNNTVRPNRVRHQVMKTFADEDGFMVTEKGWESASDDETSNKPTTFSRCDADQSQKSQSKMDNPISLTAPPTIQSTKPTKQSNKKNINNKPGSKQASLSSFFKPCNTLN